MESSSYFFLFLLAFHFQIIAGEKNVERWEMDLNGDSIPEKIAAYKFGNDIYKVVFENEQGRCECQLMPDITKQSLLYSTNTCEDYYLPENLIQIPVLDSVLKWNDLKSDHLIPAHFNFLMETYQSHRKTLNDEVLYESTFEPGPYAPVILKKMDQKIDLKRYFVEDFYWGAIPKLNLHNRKNLIYYNEESLGNAADLKNYDLSPDYPLVLDSLKNKKLLITGHSVLIEEVVQNDTNIHLCFVSDGKLWENVQKLNYRSILDAQFLDENRVLILGDAGEKMTNYLYLVNWKKGSIKMLSPGLYLNKSERDFRYIESFEIMEDEVFLFLKIAPSYQEIIEKSFDYKKLLRKIK